MAALRRAVTGQARRLVIGAALAAASAAALISGPLSAQGASVAAEGRASEDDALAALRTGLAAMIADGTLPNAQVIIAQDGKRLADFHIGSLDIETDRPLPANALFRLYSMTKPITTVAVMMLVEEGRIALEAPVARYLPEFADMQVYAGGDGDGDRGSGDGDAMATVPAARAITIRDLLTHSSGLTYNFTGDTPVHRYYRRHGIMRGGGVGGQPGDAPAARTMDELIERLAGAPLLHQPGARFSYGNSTGVLGVVVERVSGQRLDAFFKARIFDPLDMPDTVFVVDDARLDRLVTNYVATADGMAVAETARDSEYRDAARIFDGGGALAGTAEDYLHFAEMLANGGLWHDVRLLKADTVAAMFTPRLATGGRAHENVMFGYGLGIGDAASQAIGGLPAGAGGWSGSANSYFFVDPRHRLVALLMTNELIGPAQVERTVRIRSLLDRAAVQLIQQAQGVAGAGPVRR